MNPPPPTGIGPWLRWEFGRRIELTGFIKFIIIERFVKGSALVAGGIALLWLSNSGVIADWAARIQEQLILNPGRGVFHRLWTSIVLKFAHFSGTEQDAIAVGAFLYGGLECFEGFGLVLRRRWAEYLVLVATVAFIPVEIDEVVRHFTVLKLGTFVVNVAIAVYLVWRKRLFLERPGEAPIADKVAARRGGSSDATV